jgi:TonB family protein
MLGDQSLVYLVMEYADESLAHVIPVRPLATDEARQMLEPALDALAYLHGQGFVHGHIKPAHIMAVGECLKLSIAGLCRIGECPMQSGDAYTAPEGTASPAADVWSLGVTLVETLTQRLPAQGVPETLPPPFLEIARECLRSDPGGRPAAASLAARLHPDARPVARPRLKWAYALAAAVGLVVSAVVIAPRLIDREEPVQVQATAPPPEPVPKEQAAPAVRPPQNAIIQRVLPEVPAQASRTIRGKVRVSVRVEVDPSGKVTNAKLDSAGPSAYFAQLALQAARRWKFSPANEDTGKSRTWIVHFEFSRSGTKAVLGRMAKAF